MFIISSVIFIPDMRHNCDIGDNIKNHEDVSVFSQILINHTNLLLEVLVVKRMIIKIKILRKSDELD